MSLADIIFIMRHGKIISTGSPKDLYANPPDLFTAGFLGFPAMNLIDGAISNGIFLSSGSLQIPLKSNAAGRGPSAVVLGIRPEDITMSDNGPISGEIISIENLGRQELLLLKTATDDRLKLIAQGSFHVGDMIKVALNMNRSYLFDKASGKKI
jgi:ABC-type sugar transport system ATPase subunit